MARCTSRKYGAYNLLQMSLITQCPACATLFKVVADQLRVSGGWVRCGQCGDVFDAQEHLQRAEPVALAAPASAPTVVAQGMPVGATNADAPKAFESPAREPAAEGPPQAGRPGSSGFASSDNGVLQSQPVSHTPPPVIPPASAAVAEVEPTHEGKPVETEWPVVDPATLFATAPEPSGADGDRDSGFDRPQENFSASGAIPDDAVVSAVSEEPVPSIQDLHVDVLVEIDPQSPAQTSVSPETGWSDAAPAPALPPAAEEIDERRATELKGLPRASEHFAEPTFVREARRKAMWTRPVVRVLVTLGCVAAATVLAAQIALDRRHELATHWPILKPTLHALCQWRQCTIEPLRRIDQIAVEGSTFERVASQQYALSLTVRNTSSTPLAVPHFELTLTDLSNQVLARRVLTPADFVAPDQLEPQSEWLGQLSLHTAALNTDRISGYRVVAFYP
jgi:predicted Zn finger-like uncharacterized protein